MRHSPVRVLTAVLCAAMLAWSTPVLAQRHGGGGPRGGGGHGAPGRAVVVAPGWGWGGGYWGPSFHAGWGYPYWWGAWGPSPWGLWPYFDPYYMVAATTSAVRVQVQPRNAEVFVDGYYAGEVDRFDGTFQRLRLSPGQHVIELYLPGHQPVRQDLLLAPGESYKVRHTMQPLPAGAQESPRPQPAAAPQAPAFGPPAGPPIGPGPQGPPPPSPAGRAEGFGQLVVRVQPGDAEILIDGEAWRGTADALTVNLAVGSHRVEVRKAGFATFSTTVDVTAGAPAALNVSLLRDEAHDEEGSR